MISKKAEDLILQFEGFDVPWRWPTGDSGITIGRGYDLGYEPFEKDWQGRLALEDFNRLKPAVGLKGEAAHRIAPTLRGVNIPVHTADEVFAEITLPKYEEQTRKTFPNSERLPEDAFGALVSIVFNRGQKLDGDRRREMRAIYGILATKNPTDSDTIKEIARQVRSMARLWPDNLDSDGDLHDRRLREAELIESCA
jgi:GH24 family phage-related lysozyme (muramidase)